MLEMVQLRFPGGRRKAVTLSYDDGVEQDRRLIALMRRYGLKGTFNVNCGLCRAEGEPLKPGSRLSMSEMRELYPKNGMEVAVHGYSHPFLDRLPASLCAEEIRRDRAELEAQFRTIVRGMAYPMGALNDTTVRVAKMLGIAYARTTVSTGRFDLPADWLRMPATCRHTDPRFLELAGDFVEDRVPSYGCPQLFLLWGHSYEFDRDGNWPLFEEFAAMTGNRDEIWYATNIELYDYVECFRRLQFSISGDVVRNPSCRAVYLDCQDRTYCVGPGETVCLE